MELHGNCEPVVPRLCELQQEEMNRVAQVAYMYTMALLQGGLNGLCYRGAGWEPLLQGD